MIAKMRNIGEACTAANRFHVAERLQDEFTEQAGRRSSAQMKVGRGTEDDVKVGPLIDARPARQGRASSSRTPSARAPTAVLGGSAIDGQGYFFEPTVLAAGAR